jgi:membrane-bound lytic murein transglycosylase B
LWQKTARDTKAMIRVLRIFALLVAACAASGMAPAQAETFRTWLDGVRVEARGRGVSHATLEAAFADLQPIGRVLELDRKQPESTLTFEQYIQRVVGPARIERGRQRLYENGLLLEQVSRRFGVPARFIVALWGIETDFGRMTGGFPVVGALATLAYDGRRAAYFRKELLDALLILDEGNVTPEAMQGSWAGAMGQNQFMPSSFHAYAVDQDGDGRRDIWSSLPDVFASTANYLARSGWKGDETWGREVRLPPGFDKGLVGADLRKPLADWAALGVKRADGGALPTANLDAALISGEKDGSGPYFLVYDNYRVLLKWNRSNFFALAVGRLADAIQADP